MEEIFKGVGMEKYIIDFRNIKKEDVDIAGGKGANLGELVSFNINA